MLDQSHFDPLYAEGDDPWKFRTRWYEKRKRALLLAALPQPRYGRAVELGCANGELAADLAPRCADLLACDFHALALVHARKRLARFPHARIEQRCLPRDWPAGRFDLVVLSEMGYYLAEPEVCQLARAAAASLSAAGVVVACHWRHPGAGELLDGDRVHRLLRRHLGLPRLLGHLEEDFRLDLWCADGRSVARREGLL